LVRRAPANGADVFADDFGRGTGAGSEGDEEEGAVGDDIDEEADAEGGVTAEAEEVSSLRAAPLSGGVAAPSPNPSQERRRRGDGIVVRRGGVRPGGDVRRKIRPA
jgi:hypothetical protein